MKTRFAPRLTFFLTLCLILGTSTALFAGGAQDQKATRIDMADQPRQYLAPTNPDAKIRQLELPFSELTIPGTGRVIKSWTFTVYNANGNKVYEDSRLETRDRGFLGELFNVGDKPKVELPAGLTWDGTYKLPDGASNGQSVPDGNYTYLITITDDAGNRAFTPPFNLTVKNAPILIDHIRIPVGIFAPEGKRKTVAIEQGGSREYWWEGRFTDAEGKLVRSYRWGSESDPQAQEQKPADFEWDGKDNDGKVVPEGQYLYTLEGRNRSGAVLIKQADTPILVSLQAGALKVSSEQTLISPNGDGRLDRMPFAIESNELNPVVSWKFLITDAANQESVRWTKSGQGKHPGTLVWDGNDLSGRPLPDGKYQAFITASFGNGDTGASQPFMLEVDTTPPKVSLSTNTSVFGGDGKPSATISMQGLHDTEWNLEVLDKNGSQIYLLPIENPEGFSWEFVGVDRNGNTLPDGLFTLTAAGRDAAGNQGSAVVRVRKDSRIMKMRLELSQPILVPNRGKQGTVRITPILETTDSIERMDLTIADPSGTRIYNKSANTIQTFWDWNGKSDAGKQEPDGQYEVFAQVAYSNGTVSQAKVSLRIDSKTPELSVQLKASAESFNPANGPLSFQATVSPNEQIRQWKLSLIHEKEGEIQTFAGGGAVPGKISWDGRNANRSITDGKYSAKLVVSWDNGMVAESAVNPSIVLASTGPKMDLQLSSSSFVPGNIDGPQTLTIGLNPKTNGVDIESWELLITDPRGKLFRDWRGKGTPPKNLVWDGLSNLGETVESGADYTLTLRVRDALKQESTTSASVSIDIQVTRINDQSYKIVISSIQFSGNSSDIFKVRSDLLDKNIFVLRRLAAILNKFPEYRIRLEGYAVSEYWDEPKMADWEQKTQLIPLSTERAQAVRAGLMLLGVDGARFSTKGLGADKPVVPNGDLENRWKNRRVEFYLER